MSINSDQLLKKASKVVPRHPVLINVISKRVRELLRGDKALVDASHLSDMKDVALTEIIEGKIEVSYNKIS